MSRRANTIDVCSTEHGEKCEVIHRHEEASAIRHNDALVRTDMEASKREQGGGKDYKPWLGANTDHGVGVNTGVKRRDKRRG